MTPENIELFRLAREAHSRIYEHLSHLRDAINSGCGGDLRALADHAYALREVAELCDDARKESRKLQELAGRVACMIWAQGDGSAIKTEYCSAHPDIKMSVELPTLKRSPEAYAQLMQSLGVPEHLWKPQQVAGDGKQQIVEGTECFRPHWPGMVQYLTTLAEEGKPLPPGVDLVTQRPIYNLRIVRKRDIDSIPDTTLAELNERF